MPHRTLSLDEAADYLHISREDIEQLVRRREIPHEKRGNKVVFRPREIDAWASQRILGFHHENRGQLAHYHKTSTEKTFKVSRRGALMPDLIQPASIAPQLASKTKASVLRDMVLLADKTGLVPEARQLLESLQERENLCSTGLPGGLALLHPRHHDPYMFDSCFIALGRTAQGIHFSAPDGKPTDLFFLVCCQDDKIHLHTLARLCMMAQKTNLLEDLRQVSDAQAMHDLVIAAETEVLGQET